LSLKNEKIKMKVFKKLSVIVLSLAMLSVFVAPAANAATADEMQAQISALMAQITALNSQLSTSKGTTTGTSSYTFTRNLTVGSKGADVKALQELLIASGDLKIAASTSYFGTATKAALAKYQAANGISPAAGYFGAITRAKVNATATTTTGGTTTTTGGTTPVVTVGTPNSVVLAASNPASANLALGAVNTAMMKLTFTAGSAPLTVTTLNLMRTGLSQDADLNNVYLYDGVTRLASNMGISNGKINFNNASGLFTVPAGTSKEITVAVDTTTAAGSASHVIQLSLAAATDIVASTSVGGTFPVMGNSFSLVTVSNLATLQVSGTSTATVTVNAGQLGYLAGQMTLTAGSNPVKVSSIRLTNVGSIQSSALQNIKLMQGGTQLGATVAALDNGNIATFDMSAAPLMLASGQSVTLQVYVDVTGTGSAVIGRTFQFTVQQSADVVAIDNNYGVGISLTNTTGSTAIFPVGFYSATVNAGGLIISRDATSPTTNVVAGNTNQVLAKFSVLASGDTIRVNQLNFDTVNATAAISNLRIVDDLGVQLGTTRTTSATSTTYSAGTGSLNYVIAANATRVLTVYGDVATGATGSVQARLLSGTAQSNSTYAAITPGAASGNSLTVLATGTNLSASLNYAFANPTVTAGTTGAKIGSFTLTAGQVNSISMTGVTVTATASTTLAAYLQNLRVMIGSTQLGVTQPGAVTASNAYTFNATTPIVIAPNQVVSIDIYADVTNSATAGTNALVTLTSAAANVVNGNVVSISPITGQTVTLSVGGSIVGIIDSSTPAASYVGMGINDNTVAKFRFSTGTTGSATLTQVVLGDYATTTIQAGTTTTTTDRSFVNYRLVDGATTLVTASEATDGTITFNLSGASVPANGYKTLSVVADASAYPSASSSAAHALQLNSYTYTNTAGATTATTSAVSRLMTVYRTNVGVAKGAAFTAPTSLSVGATVGNFAFTANTGFDATIRTLSLTQSGALIGGAATVTLDLFGSDNPSVALARVTIIGTTASTTPVLNTTGWIVPAGTSLTLEARVVAATGLTTLSTTGSGSYQLALQQVAWNDSLLNVATLSPSIVLPIAGQNLTGLSN
jgi:hypothetical protein